MFNKTDKSNVIGQTSLQGAGFTLLELTITIALVALTAIVVLVILNPKGQINKAQDSKRKSELSVFKNALEDFYNDKGCYPTPQEVCYPGVDNGDPVSANPCFICGSEETSPDLSPYLKTIPCDPQHPTRKYLYQTDGSSCPKWYRLYTKFSTSNDPASADVGCYKGGCGQPLTYGYDYGVSSPNIGLEISNRFHCFTQEESCDNCGTYERCSDPNQSPGCQKYKRIYGSYTSCCDANPNPSCATRYCLTNTLDCINCGYPEQCTTLQNQGVCGKIYRTKSSCCSQNPGAGGC